MTNDTVPPPTQPTTPVTPPAAGEPTNATPGISRVLEEAIKHQAEVDAESAFRFAQDPLAQP